MKRGTLLTGMLLMWQPAFGEGLPETVQFHAFGAFNPITTTANNFFGKSDGRVSADFWELGLNGSWRPQKDILLSGQLTSRRAGEGDDGSVRLDYGLLDYSPFSDESNRAGIRMGRVLNPLGFNNETRDVAFTRSSILLPQSIYFDRTRDLALSSDGLQVYSDHQTPIGDFYFQANVGLPRTNNTNTERALLSQDFPGELDGDPSFLGRLIYERDGGRWRFGVSGGSVRMNYAPGSPTDPLPKGDIDFQPLFFSGQYNAESFSLTTEFGPRIFKRKGFGQAEAKTTGESFYVEGLYRFSPRWEAFLRYDVLYSDRNDRDGKQFAANDTLGRAAHSRFAKDVATGVTWRLDKSFLVRAEYHYVDGTAWLPTADNPDPADIERYWSIFALQVAFRF